MSPRNPDDRRRHIRYALKTEVFLVFRPAFDRLGTVKDVSLGGVAFEYSVFDHIRKVEETEEIDIFSSRPDHFMLRQVPCRVVYDVKLEQPSLSGIETRRCGIKFGRLSAHHRQLLKQLLASCGSRPLRDNSASSQNGPSRNCPSVA